jgi:hypothetical protein
MSKGQADWNFCGGTKSFGSELLSFINNFMSTHTLCLATQLEVDSPDRLEKNVQIYFSTKMQMFPKHCRTGRSPESEWEQQV